MPTPRTLETLEDAQALIASLTPDQTYRYQTPDPAGPFTHLLTRQDGPGGLAVHHGLGWIRQHFSDENAAQIVYRHRDGWNTTHRRIHP